MRVKESQIKRMLFCNEADTGSNFARHENEQTSDVVLNHVKRFERNNYTGVDDGDRNITDGRIDFEPSLWYPVYRRVS